MEVIRKYKVYFDGKIIDVECNRMHPDYIDSGRTLFLKKDNAIVAIVPKEALIILDDEKN